MGYVVLLIVIAAWVGCGVAGYGYTIGYFCRKFPNTGIKDDTKGLATFIGLLGPIGLIVVTAKGGFKHGWSWKCR